MGVYFLDTSALVKRYVAESGSLWVADLYRRELDNTLIISQATLVEAVATFCRKAREQNISQRISEEDRDRLIAIFRRDVRNRYNVVRITSSICNRAGDLCRIHKLRAYDAMQLASSLTMLDKLAELGISLPVFVSADTELLNAAHVEGLEIENPETRMLQ